MHSAAERGERALPVVASARADRSVAVSTHLAGLVHDRDLDARAECRGRAPWSRAVRPARPAADPSGSWRTPRSPRRRRLLQARQQVDRERRCSLRLPGQPHRLGQPLVGGPATVGDAERGPDLAARPGAACPPRAPRRGRGRGTPSLRPRSMAERAVRGHVLDALAEVEIVGELGALRRPCP